MKHKVVTHPGIVNEIIGNQINVTIVVSSGCSSCEIKGSCSVSEADKKSVLVTVTDPSMFSINDSVIIEMKQSLGTWAVLLGYVFPFLLVVSSLIILTNTELDQGIAGLISLSLLIPYYLVIYSFRNYIGSKFNYDIRA
ncbi:MAG: SoxR reducing system RseC family protein [Lentimicrobiaceae bacterium]|jgi:sigma-E factor negative regulatory protein RseC|nr:SoxR reducing system RseC family protein [Lentimicrobiaceae bacterium]MBT3454790.1 SoxR reducing system RseC family protein [Lentimicrobiaceae bacterium]MBT3819606.1 SoxR reducing system RseC family protein [Lentimicrobiaceae bacterium]MBT4061316.1 SoxR reducing system RseC family protein [Lentimicrobiaceae bacterium]MBT4191519.1 SoxR reducing system RseC family protein [Lentimicrobiaceae bacterium]